MDKNAKKPAYRQARQKFYSIMIVPHDAQGRPISFKIPASWVYGAVSITLFSIVLVGSSVVYSTLLSRRLVTYTDAMSKTRQQQAVINSFSDKTNKVVKVIDELVKEDNELRRLLGLSSWKSKINISTTKSSSEVVTDKISLRLQLANMTLAERRESLNELKNWVDVVRSKLASTPSTWPIYGRLVSFFGYRSYPWRGLHTGVDIQSRWGAPARVTANGVVSYVGWRQGYGKTVEVDHGNGVKTLYAHNSGYAVSVGQKVRRGQVICYVGTTGWTTGPHLHYEVKRWDRPINPVAFLNLNLFTASRLWGGKVWD